jgi:hypothetical protein
LSTWAELVRPLSDASAQAFKNYASSRVMNLASSKLYPDAYLYGKRQNQSSKLFPESYLAFGVSWWLTGASA